MRPVLVGVGKPTHQPWPEHVALRSTVSPPDADEDEDEDEDEEEDGKGARPRACSVVKTGPTGHVLGQKGPELC